MYGKKFSRPVNSVPADGSQDLPIVDNMSISQNYMMKGRNTSRKNSVMPVRNKQTSSPIMSVRSVDDSDDGYSMDNDRPTASQHPCVHVIGLMAVLLTPIAVFAMIVAIGTNYWFRHQGNDIGLFVYCQNWTKVCDTMTSYVTSQSVSARTAWGAGTPILLAGTALMLISTFCLLCYPCHNRVNFSKLTCGVIITVVMVLGCILAVVGTSLFAYHYFSNQSTWQIQWSFYLGCGGALGLVIPTILFVVHVVYTACLK